MTTPTYCLVHDTANLIGRYEPIACVSLNVVNIVGLITLFLIILASVILAIRAIRWLGVAGCFAIGFSAIMTYALIGGF